MSPRPLLFRPLPCLLAIALVTAGLLLAWATTLEAPSDPNTKFSGKAAHQTLGVLLRENRPHPVGTPENAVVRDRIVAELRTLGYEPRLQSKFQCSPYGCCQVDNVIAVRAGTARQHAVVAMAHYDSVIAGPGAADDGSGVAVLLEMAKQLTALPPARNDVILLFTDGEEFALSGAAAFVESAPEMKTVRAVVNVEARGNAGPSIMFETGRGNAKLLALYADAVARPVTNSVANEVYRRLPNDTDFTMFREAGHVGFNLAFLGKASLYHSQNDTVDRVSVASLQHHGDNALALVTALAATDLTSIKADDDASYFDLYGRVLVRWPAAANLPAAVVALLAILALGLRRRRELSAGKIAWATAIAVFTLPILFGVGYALSFPLGRIPNVLLLDHPAPWPARAALLATALLSSIALGAFAARRGVAALSGWIALALLGIATSLVMPGAAYAMIAPPLVYAIVGWVLVKREQGALWATAAGVVVALHFWIGHMVLLESALGFQQAAIKAALLGPLVWGLTSLWSQVLAGPGARAIIPGVLTALAVAASAALAALVPATTPDRPRGINVTYAAGGKEAPKWTVVSENPLPQRYLDAHGFVKTVSESRRERAVAQKPAPALELPAPAFEAEPATTTPEGHRRLAGTVRYAANARLAGVTIADDSGVLSLRLEGQLVWDDKALDNPRLRQLRIGGVADRPLRLELVVRKGATGAISLYHRLPLPDTEETRAFTKGRAADVLPFGAGDGAMIVTPLAP